MIVSKTGPLLYDVNGLPADNIGLRNKIINEGRRLEVSL
jgi:hypothetical protein